MKTPYRIIDDNTYERIFCIGDIHGCDKELGVLLDALIGEEKLSTKDLLIFVGDYIDRGKASKEVVDRLIGIKDSFPNTVFLKGNHEDMLLHYIGKEGRGGDVYMVNGGKDTLSSYGVTEDNPSKFLTQLPEAHLNFFENLDRYAISNQHIFVHAGLDPLCSLHTQNEEDLFWIRDEFIFNIHHFARTVIFGHTPFQELMLHTPYKIGIDTGLVFGNKLSCVEVKSSTLYQVTLNSEEVIKSSFIPQDSDQPAAL
jgi:serine/threonine protein phosphatase 1